VKTLYYFYFTVALIVIFKKLFFGTLQPDEALIHEPKHAAVKSGDIKKELF
jgi:hypothetical protein